MKYIFILCLFTFTLFSSEFTLTNMDKKKINKLYNKDKILKRFSNFNDFFQKTKEFNELKKMYRVNSYVNRIISKNDAQNKWLTPKEFLIIGRGDCEDYAITKYFALKKLNIDVSKLYLSVVKMKGSRNYHMVLLHINNKQDILVFDNLSWKLLPLTKRKNMEFKYAFNENGSYIFENNKLVKEKNIRRGEVKLFRKILKGL